MRSIPLHSIALAAFFLSTSAVDATQSLSPMSQGATACVDPAPVERLACRLHREAVWSVASQLSGIARINGAAPLRQSMQRPGLVENVIHEIAAELRKAGVSLPDLGKHYHLQVILSALDAIPALVSSANYAYGQSSETTFNRPRTPAQVLEESSGLCGHAAEIFQIVLTKLGLKTRPVQFWWTDDDGNQQNHIGVEVFWDRSWRYFDPLFGAYFVRSEDEAGPLDVRSAGSAKARSVVNPNGTNYRYAKLAQLEPLDYVRRPGVDVTIAEEGTINVRVRSDNDGFRTKFENVPNYFGDNQEDGDSEGLRLQFQGMSGRFDVSLDVAGAAGCQSSRPSLNGHSFPPMSGVHIIRDVANPSMLEVSGPDDICYVVLNSVSFTPADKLLSPSP